MSSTSETRMQRKKRVSRLEETRTRPPLLMLMVRKRTAPGLKMGLMMMAKRAVRRRVV
jgi:hypothetical protein